MTAPRPTVAGYLAAPLGVMRVRTLERLAGQFDSAPLADTVDDLHAVLIAGIGMEDHTRLQILITRLYHACGASITLTEELRAEAAAALPGAANVRAFGGR